jgi:Sulfotransferase domain
MRAGQAEPNFLIVGASKSGTTWIANTMAMHPNIFISRIKEPCFFTTEKPESEWVQTWDEYLDLFKDAASYQWCGEASTPYLYYYEEVIPQVRERLRRDCKIIAIIRNPVERSYSMYCHNRKDVRESLSYSDALDAEDIRQKNKWPLEFHYKKMGFVTKGLKAYIETFGAGNVGVFLYDDLRRDNIEFMKSLYGFLDIAAPVTPTLPFSNVSGIPKIPKLYAFLYKRAAWKEPLKRILPANLRQNLKKKVLESNLEKIPMPETERLRLTELYRGEIAALEKLINRDLSHWRAP